MSQHPTGEHCRCESPHDEAANRRSVFSRILVAVDDTEPARWAMKTASRMARGHGAVVALVHVTPPAISLTPEFAMMHADLAEDHRQAGQALLDKAASDIEWRAKPELILKEGEAAKQIIAAAREWAADVIVIGTHGRSAMAHMLLGSTAETVVRNAHSPVLTVGCNPKFDEKDQDKSQAKSEPSRLSAIFPAGAN